jgi:glycosyltransferase involved in cell wall biosynthesis
MKIFDNITLNELIAGDNLHLEFENQKLNNEVERLNRIFALRIYHFLKKHLISRLFLNLFENIFDNLYLNQRSRSKKVFKQSHSVYMTLDEWSEQLIEISSQKKSKVLIAISHEMSNTGAPKVLFDFLKSASSNFGVKVFIINCRDGEKSKDFIDNFPTILLSKPSDKLSEILKDITNSKNVRILLNTIAHLDWVDMLCADNIKFAIWQHEQKTSWEFYSKTLELILSNATTIIVGSRELEKDLVNYKKEISYKISYHDYGLNFKVTKSKNEINQLLQIQEDTKLILLAGSRSIRKGFDLLPKLVDNLSRIVKENTKYLILWIGDSVSNELDLFIVKDISKLKNSEFVLVCGGLENYADFFNRANVIVHLAREDTKPQVLMLASKMEKPIVTFFDIEMDSENLNNLNEVDYQDFQKMSHRINQIITSENNREEHQIGNYDDWDKIALEMINDIFNTEIYRKINRNLKNVKKDSKLAKDPDTPVSAIIPNYNHEKFIKERIFSILNQKYKPSEIILLDDASDDKSIVIAEEILITQNIPYYIDINATNSGFPISQWARGIELAKYPIVWIAESDDLSTPDFLLDAVASMTRNKTEVYFCESVQIDEFGIDTNFQLENNYRTIPCVLNAPEDHQEIVFQYSKLLRDGMNIRNLFINVSAMVFDKESISNAINGALRTKLNRQVADWHAYLLLDPDLNVSFSKIRNNLFRKTQNGLTFSKQSLEYVRSGREEIYKMIYNNKERYFNTEIDFEAWKIKFQFENYRIGKIINET